MDNVTVSMLHARAHTDIHRHDAILEAPNNVPVYLRRDVVPGFLSNSYTGLLSPTFGLGLTRDAIALRLERHAALQFRKDCRT